MKGERDERLEVRPEGSLGGSRPVTLLLRHEIEARITVKEFATPKTSDMKFLATADIELNQKTLKFQPIGWGETLLSALAECMRNLRKFEYEIEDQPTQSKAD
jgi:hypothetical protein